MAIASFVSRKWVEFLDGFLPRRVKRMIFLSSLLAYIQGNHKPDEELVNKLNQLLHLSNSAKSAMVPPLLNERIWADVVSRTEPVGNTGIVLAKLSEMPRATIVTSQARILSDNIIRKSPQWLRYGTTNQMRADLVKLLVNVNNLQNG